MSWAGSLNLFMQNLVLFPSLDMRTDISVRISKLGNRTRFCMNRFSDPAQLIFGQPDQRKSFPSFPAMNIVRNSCGYRLVFFLTSKKVFSDKWLHHCLIRNDGCHRVSRKTYYQICSVMTAAAFVFYHADYRRFSWFHCDSMGNYSRFAQFINDLCCKVFLPGRAAS